MEQCPGRCLEKNPRFKIWLYEAKISSYRCSIQLNIFNRKESSLCQGQETAREFDKKSPYLPCMQLSLSWVIGKFRITYFFFYFCLIAFWCFVCCFLLIFFFGGERLVINQEVLFYSWMKTIFRFFLFFFSSLKIVLIFKYFYQCLIILLFSYLTKSYTWANLHLMLIVQVLLILPQAILNDWKLWHPLKSLI